MVTEVKKNLPTIGMKNGENFDKNLDFPSRMLSYCHSCLKENVVVLISDEEVQKVFTEALRLMNSKSELSIKEVPRIYHVKDYRGCENSSVMCVGVSDAWMVEGISRAIQTLLIIDGGNTAAAQSRIGLWEEMDRKGLLRHRPLAPPNVLEFLSDEDWKILNQKSLFLKVQLRFS